MQDAGHHDSEPLERFSPSPPARPLLVATPGGHLTQLLALIERMGIDGSTAVWVSHRTAQSESLLAGLDVVWAHYARPRDVRRLLGHARLASAVIRQKGVSMVLSTGASLAPPFLAAGRLARLPSHYVESATRASGPSLSGRLSSLIPGVHLYSQHQAWAGGRWQYAGSVLDSFTTSARERAEQPQRFLVTVGSARDYPFASMIAAVLKVLPRGCNVTWQIGDNSGAGLPGRVVRDLPASEMRTLMREADCVISHAGTGSVVTCLQLGVLPVVIPRSASRGEHIDDHQSETAAMLAERGLAVVRTPGALSRHDLFEAASFRVVAADLTAFRLAS